MEYENIIFHPQILLSKQTDTCSTDYFSPLMDGTLTVPVLYQPGDAYYGEISACVDANDEISKTNPPAYQLFIKSQLFMLFYILFNKCSSRNAQKKDYKSLEKMKLILKFVENNYMEKITIEDVAKEVSLSQSHFMKYFKNTMGTSFIDYLNEYRLTMASRLLISSDSSVLDIAAEVGFDNLQKTLPADPEGIPEALCTAITEIILSYNSQQFRTRSLPAHQQRYPLAHALRPARARCQEVNR